MRDMTWADLKALVEAAGVQETDTIDWFDFSYPHMKDDGQWTIEVFYDADKHQFTVH